MIRFWIVAVVALALAEPGDAQVEMNLDSQSARSRERESRGLQSLRRSSPGLLAALVP